MNTDDLYFLNDDKVYAALKALVASSMKGAHYPMTLRSQSDWSAVATAVNAGIDAHLEAVTERSTFDASTGECSVHPEELPVLIRRLMDGDEDAQQLGEAIVSTLEEDEE